MIEAVTSDVHGAFLYIKCCINFNYLLEIRSRFL